MKNITPRKIRPLYDGQTVNENTANIQQTINDASFCLLLIQDCDGYTINAFNDFEAIKSYAYTLHGAKINKNGSRIRYSHTDYENGADVFRVTFNNSDVVYQYHIKII